MNLTGGIVLYAVIWFLTFYIVLMVRTRTQAEEGHVVKGTPPGAPAHETVGKSALIATAYGTLIWAVIAGVILSGKISLYDIDFLNVLGPEPTAE